MEVPGEDNGTPLQYSCLENPMGGGAWWAAVHGVAESDMTEVTQQQQQQGARTRKLERENGGVSLAFHAFLFSGL